MMVSKSFGRLEAVVAWKPSLLAFKKRLQTLPKDLQFIAWILFICLWQNNYYFVLNVMAQLVCLQWHSKAQEINCWCNSICHSNVVIIYVCQYQHRSKTQRWWWCHLWIFIEMEHGVLDGVEMPLRHGVRDRVLLCWDGVEVVTVVFSVSSGITLFLLPLNPKATVMACPTQVRILWSYFPFSVMGSFCVGKSISIVRYYMLELRFEVAYQIIECKFRMVSQHPEKQKYNACNNQPYPTNISF